MEESTDLQTNETATAAERNDDLTVETPESPDTPCPSQDNNIAEELVEETGSVSHRQSYLAGNFQISRSAHSC